MLLAAILAVAALAVALSLRPWRLLSAQHALLSPLLATLVVLPWLWALPALHHAPLQLQWSGAVLVLLMLGWPLAIPVLLAVAAISHFLSPALNWQAALGLAVWQGVVPATLALLWGALLRRWCWHNIFVFILARGFLGTVLSVFIATLLGQAAGHVLPSINEDLSRLARWLMAWGDGVITGMLTAVFVVFKPQWMATWSDAIYLEEPPGP